MSTVDPLIYHNETEQIQERMSAKLNAQSDWTLWVTVMNQSHHISNKKDADYSMTLNGVSVGVDRVISLEDSYATQGLFFTHSDTKVHFRGKGIGGGKVSSWSTGVYASYHHPLFWLDGMLKANRFSQDIYGRMTSGQDAYGGLSTLGLGATVRLGKDMVAGPATFTPYIRLNALKTTRSDFVLSNRMEASISPQSSVLGKAGLRALYQTKIKETLVTPWMDLGIEREFMKGNSVRINQTDFFENDLRGLTGVYSLGISANLSQTMNVSAVAGYKKGQHIESPWHASLALSLTF